MDVVPPRDLPCPLGVASWLRDASQPINAHGFTERELGTAWWSDALTKSGLIGYSVNLTPQPEGEPRLTRGDLFQRAALFAQRPDDEHACLGLLWHVLSWGSGLARRNNRRRIEAFTNQDERTERVALLCAAASSARNGERRTAYGSLIRRGGGVIPGLGPAFFTKFLYFSSMATSHEAAQPCLILDARVATSLHTAGWKTVPKGSFNWYTDQYVAYCELLDRWASQLTSSTGRLVRPDEIERALFTLRLR